MSRVLLACLLGCACAGRAPSKVDASSRETAQVEDDGDDADGDGYTAVSRGGADCDDADPDIHPGQAELCADGEDNDCDGVAGSCGLESAQARIEGALAAEGLGFSAGLVGDADGDGDAELMAGGVTADLGAADGGGVWLFAGPVTEPRRSSEAMATLGGAEEDDALGYAVAGPGDLDGDGYADPVVSAPYAGDGVGVVYALASPVTGLWQVDELDGAWRGLAAGDRAGIALAGAGDVDGDGLADLLVGANTSDSAAADAGEVFVLLGPDALEGGELADSAARIWGEAAGDRAGRTAGAGDVDGDGLADLLIGAPESDAAADSAGLACLILSPPPVALSLADADLRLLGEVAGERAGVGLAGLGDADGDGRADLAVGANSADGEGTDAGRIWLLVAVAEGVRSLAEADLVLDGESASDMAGWPLTAPGDLDEDGLADLLVGAFGNDRAAPGAGAVYAVSGLERGTGSLAGSMGRWLGEAEGDFAGFSLDAGGPGPAGEVPTILIGAYGRSSGAGGVYVLEGMY